MTTATLDLTPRPGAQPALRRVWRQGLLETRLMIRQGEQVLLALVIPVALLVGGTLVGGRFGLDRDPLVGSVLAMAVWSTAFTSIAIATGFDRRQGVLERLAATPLGRTGLVGGKIVAVVLMTALQWVVLLGVGLPLGWRPSAGFTTTLVMLVGVVLAAAAFTALALALAGTLRAEATLGLANLIYLVGLVAGIVVSPAALGSPWRTVVELLPTGALGEVMRAWTGSAPAPWWALLVLAVWALAGFLLARKVFRWTM
ncbi:ABC transporter permease [Propionibacteriaceae bacterium Y1923]|uniref:ABC transporter permease n=1 Tax=Aestuariimicrobium sp. Y1814 TaxID=3418742 RepID=UPI003C29BED3